MTQEEANASVNAAYRWCRGPTLIKEPELDTWRQRFRALDKADLASSHEEAQKARRALVAFKNEVEDRQGTDHPQVGDSAQAVHRIITVLFARGDFTLTPCGFPVNTILLKGVFDGEMHLFTCPKCGEPGNYTLPKVNE